MLPDCTTLLKEVTMEYFSHVKEVHVEPDYILNILFKDGVRKRYDMKPQLYGTFEVLKNPELFKKAFVICGSVAWDGKHDIAPEELYWNGTVI